MFSRYQAREDVYAILQDCEVVKAAAVLLTTVLDHTHPSPLGAIVRGQFFQANHPVRNAVHGFVQGLGCQIVQQQQRGVVTHEVMLDRQDLPAVAQRALRQQTNLGQAVEYHAGRLEALDRVENLLGGFAQFQVGGIQQALLGLGIEQAFRRRQFENMDVLIQVPAV
ncbi:hypothetical protein D3C73_905950 [compost metagenome]